MFDNVNAFNLPVLDVEDLSTVISITSFLGLELVRDFETVEVDLGVAKLEITANQFKLGKYSASVIHEKNTQRLALTVLDPNDSDRGMNIIFDPKVWPNPDIAISAVAFFSMIEASANANMIDALSSNS